MINNVKQEIQTDKYVGIPYIVNGRDFSGIDCYGLVRLVYKEELGIDLPNFVEEGINPDRTQELISQYKEGWERTESIQAGDVVIFKVMGVDAHIAIAVSATHFLHARNGHNSAIESFDSSKWKTRLVASYKYSPVKSVVLNGTPHPLRTERITAAIPPGINVVQLEEWILNEYKIDAKLRPYVKVLVNGVPIPDAMKEATVLQDSDCVEYRVLPQGGDPLRSLLTIAVVIAVAYATGGTAVGGLGWGSSLGVAGTAATGLALTAVGMALVDAIAPVRLPSSNFGDPADPGSAERQLISTGGANRATPYGAIPMVLGRVRMTPPIGANTYYMFSADGKESYLNMLLTWGYGPLHIDESSLRIGEIDINTAGTYAVVSNVCTVTCNNHGLLVGTERLVQFTSGGASTLSDIYKVTAVTTNTVVFSLGTANTSGDCLLYNTFEGINQITQNRIVEPTGGQLSLFNGLYGTDKTQIQSGVELTCDGWDNFPVISGLINSATLIVTATYLTGSMAAKQKYFHWDLNAWIPVTISYSVVGTTATFTPAYPVDTHPIYYSYIDQNLATPGPWLTSSSTDGAASDFTVAIHFPQGCRKIASKGSSAGQSFASPVAFQIEYKKASASDWLRAEPVEVGATAVKDAFTWTKTIAYESDEDVQVRVRRLTGTGTGAATDENYQWLFTSQLLNVTFSRNVLPAVDPVGATIAKTAFKIKSSDQLNGQLEGINAIVTTVCKDFENATYNVTANDLTTTLDSPTITVTSPSIIDALKSKIYIGSLLSGHTGFGASPVAVTNVVVRPESMVITFASNATSTSTDSAYTITNTNLWVSRASNNPASLFRYVLESPANPRKVTDAANKINLTQLQYWHGYCISKGFTFNSVLGSTRSVLDILGDICAAGRASPAMIDGKWTVVIDEPKANVVQHFSPHNSWGFEGTKALPKIPDGLRVTFINEAKDYQEDESIVYTPGKTQATATLLETISVPGVTTSAGAKDHARWHMAQAKLRPESYTLNSDIEYIVCNRGDRVKVMHDVAMWGLGSGRIKNKISTTVIELTESLPIDFASSYSIRFRSKTGSSNDRVIQKTFTPTLASRTSGVVTVTSAGHPLMIGDSVAVTMTGVSLNADPAIVTVVTTDTFSYALAGANVGSTAVTGTVNLNDGYYSKIKITATADTTVADNDDLFLFGLLNQESQDCVVLAIEPMDNKSARLTLADYGVTNTYNIFTDYLTYTAATAFESQISLPPKLLIQSFGTKVPTITGFISDERVMERIAAGVFAYKMKVSYTNAAGLPATVSTVEFQWDYADAVDYLGTRSKQTPYNFGSITITDVDEGDILKVRARYVGSDGRTGQWTAWQNHTIVGKKSLPSSVTGLVLTPDAVTGKLNCTWNKNTEVDLKGYEVRTDTNWGNVVNQVFLGDATSCVVNPAVVGSSVTVYIRAIDYSNNVSLTPTSSAYTTAAIVNVSSATYSFYDTSTTSATVTVDWIDVAPTFGLKGYEITFDGVTKVINGSFLTVAANWIGSRSFTIKTIDLNGQKSTGFIYNIGKNAPSAPIIASFSISQGTVTLDWPDSVKTSLPIWGYEVRTDVNFGTAGFLFKGATSSCAIAKSYLNVGSNTFYIKTIDTDGYYSNTYYTALLGVAIPTNTTAATHVFTDTSLTTATVTIDWADVAPIFSLKGYEITYGSIVKLVNASTITLPADWVGDRSFTIKTIDLLDNKSTGFVKTITKLVPAAPITSAFAVNQGILNVDWNDSVKTTLPVWGYEVRTDVNFGTAGYIFKGTASTCPIPNINVALGVNNYYIKAIDTDNNYSGTYLTATYTKLAPTNVLSVTHSFYDTSTTSSTVTLDWPDVVPLFNLNYYEVTYGSVVKTVKASTIVLPADWIGVRAFTIKVVDLLGNKSSGFTYNVTKLVPNAPTTANFTIDQATVILDWPDAVKTSLPVWGYEVRTDTNFGTAGFKFKGAVSNCRITGPVLGDNTFYIKTIDTDNNYSSAYFTAAFNVTAPPDITTASHVFTDTSLTAATITLDWSDVAPQFKLAQYEITYGAVVKTALASTITLPADWIGERTFTIKSVDALGNKSAGFAKVVNKLAPNPVTNFRAQVIDNNVMFYWDLPAKTSLPIDHVLMKKGAVWASAAVIGEKKGSFSTSNEMQAGTYTYWIAVVDTDNNLSTPVQLTTKVSEPPDFVFHADYTSTFGGTKSSAAVENSKVILPIDTTETFQQHFTSNGWTTPQAQITAGYPVYIQPANGSGYYEETFDFGAILSSSRVTLVYNGVVVAGSPVITTNISVSDDNVTYVSYNGASDIYATAFRYVKVRFIVTESTGTGLYSLSYLNVKLDAKLINDAGTASGLSTDTLGTIVNFNKAFIDVTSITLSVGGTTPLTAVYDFNGNNVAGTYSVTSNVCTVTSTAHGLITGQKVRLQFSTGLGISGVYTITGYAANTFTVAMVVANTSGNCLHYAESFRFYLFSDMAGTRASAPISWSVKGY